ncbi:MAG: bifunctional phosphopantothenoylcysteine decarboxylase/phosphopantothenate--cysteine ligase CoaBC [Gemmatimonadales bacterium]
MWQGRTVVLGVAGGIAAYKSVELARELTRRGAAVDVILTRGAGEFVGAATFEAVTHRRVHSSLWEPGTALDHLALSRGADLVLVAPATAHLLARAAAGLADDFLTALLLGNTSPVVAAPAMNDVMYAAAATRVNIAALVSRGWSMVGPATGELAEGPSDAPGRMAEPEEILAHAARTLRRGGPLDGVRCVVTAGPTREAIDPVRVITNRSSGIMGYRIAEAAWERGCEVTLITGPSAQRAPVGVEVVPVVTTDEMLEAVRCRAGDADVLIMAAAPADYRPARPATHKTPRGDGPLTLTLEPTPDILVETAPARRSGAVVVGFALETDDDPARVLDKLRRKDLAIIVANNALEPGAGFEVDTNAVTIYDRVGGVTPVSLRSKREVAEAILDAVERRRG